MTFRYIDFLEAGGVAVDPDDEAVKDPSLNIYSGQFNRLPKAVLEELGLHSAFEESEEVRFVLSALLWWTVKLGGRSRKREVEGKRLREVERGRKEEVERKRSKGRGREREVERKRSREVEGDVTLALP